MVDDEQLEQLRFVLARAYERRRPFVFELIHAVKGWIGPHIQKKPIIETLKIETQIETTKTPPNDIGP